MYIIWRNQNAAQAGAMLDQVGEVQPARALRRAHIAGREQAREVGVAGAVRDRT
jgi:hypothetical protein